MRYNVKCNTAQVDEVLVFNTVHVFLPISFPACEREMG